MKKIRMKELRIVYPKPVDFLKSGVEIVKVEGEVVRDTYENGEDVCFDFGTNKEFDWGSFYYSEIDDETILEYFGDIVHDDIGTLIPVYCKCNEYVFSIGINQDSAYIIEGCHSCRK